MRTAVAKPRQDALAEWTTLRDEALACRACDLWRPATQTVFGEGPVDAPLMLVGEQPGDAEERRTGHFEREAGFEQFVADFPGALKGKSRLSAGELG